MSGNVYNESGATSVEIHMTNNTEADKTTGIKTCQLGLCTDTKRLIYKDNSGNVYRTPPIDSGDICDIPYKLGHYGDSDTSLVFHGDTDRVQVIAGGVTMIDAVESASDVLTINPGNADVDTVINTDSGETLRVDGADSMVYIAQGLHVGAVSGDPGDNNLIVDGTATVSSTTDSTTKDTGAIITEGGIGVEKAVFAGTTISSAGNMFAGAGLHVGATSGDPGDNNLLVDGTVHCSAANYRRYYHIAAQKLNPGAAGASWVNPSANSLGGWQLSNNSHVLIMTSDIHADWDGASDIMVEVRWHIGAAYSAGDDCTMNLVCYYAGIGDTATKTQTVQVITDTTGTQYKVYNAEFTIDYDKSSNVVEVGDHIHFIFSIDTADEIKNVVVEGASLYYNTTHIGIESGDV